MARGINKVILVGNLGNDPETKYTQGGMAVTTLSLATTSVRKDKDGQTQERTEWHRVKLFGKLGEIAGEYLRKGRQVYIEGSIRYDKFTGQDGVEKYFTDIIADEMQMLGGGDAGGGGGERPARSSGGGGERSARPSGGGGGGGGYGGGRQDSAPRREAPPAKSNDFGDDFADDDIPF
ncbi:MULTISPECIES: single-stranded DNA-binding protein [Lysobacter]|jgi:single-strand DNA-binding protein|uniref:Single-stranded DNA-binding protein n=1 Tax=Lysobacter antibioticus TaxID=84531 RepID=A0A0S2F8F4_LYSAN|nr:single-stranded DNA-binding protein [Lysobacter antibioticus]ALN79814.1 single-stranded DNA-binding family protein [Lysobacter antibioticus]